MTVIWSKQTIAESINQKVDIGSFPNSQYILPNDIDDELVEKFQELWNSYGDQHVSERNKLLTDLYEHIMENVIKNV